MTALATALASHDMALASPPGDDDPAWPKCENCGTDLDDNKPGVFYCSLACAYEAGMKGERAMWRERLAPVLALIDELCPLAIDAPAALYDEYCRLDDLEDDAVRQGREMDVIRIEAARHFVQRDVRAMLEGAISGVAHQLYEKSRRLRT
jgi:hypothetical protein